jgi:hypothetical protein
VYNVPYSLGLRTVPVPRQQQLFLSFWPISRRLNLSSNSSCLKHLSFDFDFDLNFSSCKNVIENKSTWQEGHANDIVSLIQCWIYMLLLPNSSGPWPLYYMSVCNFWKLTSLICLMNIVNQASQTKQGYNTKSNQNQPHNSRVRNDPA